MSGSRDIDILNEAIESKNMPEILACLNSRIDLNQQGVTGWTPLSTASKSPDTEEILRMLLMRGASPDIMTLYGWTPLHCAVQKGNQKAAEILIENKANLDVRSQYYGRVTPLLAASEVLIATSGKNKSSFECIKLLLHHRADASLADEKGNTALDNLKRAEQSDLISSTCKMLEEAMRKEKNEPDEPARRLTP